MKLAKNHSWVVWHFSFFLHQEGGLMVPQNLEAVMTKGCWSAPPSLALCRPPLLYTAQHNREDAPRHCGRTQASQFQNPPPNPPTYKPPGDYRIWFGWSVEGGMVWLVEGGISLCVLPIVQRSEAWHRARSGREEKQKKIFVGKIAQKFMNSFFFDFFWFSFEIWVNFSEQCKLWVNFMEFLTPTGRHYKTPWGWSISAWLILQSKAIFFLAEWMSNTHDKNMI